MIIYTSFGNEKSLDFYFARDSLVILMILMVMLKLVSKNIYLNANCNEQIIVSL